MGTTSSSTKKTKEIVVKEKKEYSWEKRKTVDRSNFIVSKKNEETIIKAPGSLNGEQFCIEECVDCKIYALDHCTSVTIDQCSKCLIFIGPCDTSVFVRDCKDCIFMIACQQFRARNLANCELWLFSTTEPVLEVSPDLKIGCFNLTYPQLNDQLEKAKLSLWNNRYSEVHNFTLDYNYTILSKKIQIESESKTKELFLKPLETYLSSLSLSSLSPSLFSLSLSLSSSSSSSSLSHVNGIPLSFGLTNRSKTTPRCLIFVISETEFKFSNEQFNQNDTPSTTSTTSPPPSSEVAEVTTNTPQETTLWISNILKLCQFGSLNTLKASEEQPEEEEEEEEKLVLIQSRKTILNHQKTVEIFKDSTIQMQTSESSSSSSSLLLKKLSKLSEQAESSFHVVGMEWCGNIQCASKISEVLSQSDPNSEGIVWCLHNGVTTQPLIDSFFDEWREKI